ncbi:MAG: cytochrome c biogenesis protein CcdA [Negativicutes bacterium]|nr:cytochrome c biogenesis protein CcdA [Negativicutes bacterium]
MLNDWLDILSNLIRQSTWLAPLMAFLAGALTSFTPCALVSVPLVIGYVGGASSGDTRKAFKLSLTFALGMAITFTAMGIMAALFGQFMGTTAKWWYLVLGTLMVLMALQTFELYEFIPSTYLTAKSTKKGYLGAFIAGILGGIFATPCSTPALVVLLGLVARSGNVEWGILLLLLYSLGHSVLVLLAGTSVGLAKRITSSPEYGVFSNVVKWVMGGVILLIAFYMFYLGF